MFFIKPGLTVTIDGLRIANGEAIRADIDGLGGGIYNGRSTLTLNDCIVGGCSARIGGGIYNDRSTLMVNDCIISGNSARVGGGICNPSFGGLNATLTVADSILSENSAEVDGGGIYNLGQDATARATVERCTLDGNLATRGGGGIENVSALGAAILTVRSSTLTRNSASEGGGGGIENLGANTNSTTTATILNSTFSGNSALNGGAIYNDGAAGGTVTIAAGNCTLSGNFAEFGAAIFNDEGEVKVLGCTLSGNSATDSGAGIFNGGSLLNGPKSITTIGNTILKQGASLNLNGNFGGGRFISLGFNVSSDDGIGNFNGIGDQINLDPRLGPLADNGGPTFTHLPLAGSPAIDRGSSDLLATLGPPTDQRGLPRLFDDPGTPNAALADGTDIGAVEVQQPTARNLVWRNLSSGDWSVAANWEPNFVPGSNDNAIVNVPSTITINEPAACFGLTLGSSSNAPTLTGSGTLTLHGPSAWFSGTMSGSGRTVVEASATLSIPNAVGSTPVLNARTLENRGTTLLGRNLVGVMGGAVMANGPGGLFQVEHPNAVFLGGGIANGRFDNAGEFRKTASSGPLTLSSGLRFHNSGSVTIEANLLFCSDSFTNNGAISLSPGTTNRFALGGAGNGTISVPPTALVEWTGGTFTLDSGAQLNGDGLYRISSPASVAANASFAVQNLDLVAGTLGGTGTVTIANAMNWTGGTMGGGGRTIIPVGVVLNAALPSGGGLNARTLENAGTVVWTGAGNIGFVSSVITNRAGALFEAKGAGGMTFVSGPNRFDNAGLFRKTLNAGTLDISGVGSFNNFSTVEIQAGTFQCGVGFTNIGVVQLSDATTNRLAGGGSATGTFETPATALMEWTGRSFALNPGVQLNGPGLHRINGTSANVAVNGNVSVQNFDLVSGDSALGALSGTGRLTIEHAMNWTGGAMSGAGRTVVSPAATLSLANASSIGLERTLENAGTVDWTGSGTVGLLNGVITNRAGALFQAQNSARFFFAGGSCRFDNAGTFRKLGAAGTTTIDAGLPFNNAGTVDIRSGILAANGGFISTSNALLNVALGGTQAGTNHGQLRTSGTITLNGGLNVDLLPGYTPVLNDTFAVLTAGTRAGAFNKFSYPSNVVSMQLSNSPIAVLLGVTNFTPPPETTPTLNVQIQAGQLQICWPTSSNATYRVEFNVDLNTTNWTALSGNITATNSTTCFTDALGVSNRFYRVRLSP